MIVYFEQPAPRALSAYVKCFWRLRASTTLDDVPPPDPIIPDGCVELILHLGEPFSRHDAAGRAERQAPQLVAGQITTAIVVQASTTMNVWGIRFHPWAAGVFFDVSGVALRDQVASLDELSPALARALGEVRAFETDDEQLRYLVGALTAHVRTTRRPDARIGGVLDAVVGGNVDLTVRQLSKHIGVSARRADAMFRHHVGLSPKQVLRIYRFQRALGLRRAMSTASWGKIAAQAGYYDQAHFVRDAKAISGTAPTSLVIAGMTEIFLVREEQQRARRSELR